MIVIMSDNVSSNSIKFFSFGCTLAVVLLTFQYEHKLRLFNSPRLMFTLPALSLVSICGLGAAAVGLIYPILINTLNKHSTILDYPNPTLRKSQFCKSVVIFLGINHLCTKIPFRSDLHFTLTLAFLCIAFWWWFDRCWLNFLFSTLVSILLTIIIEILLRSGVLEYTYSDFYLKTCVPCLTFAGAILTIQMSILLSTNQQNNNHITTEHLKSH